MATKTLLTYDDYAALPKDGKRYELLAGVLYVVASPNVWHQRASKRLHRQLEMFFEQRGLAEVFAAPLDVVLGPHDVAEPDILVARPRQYSRRGIEGPPTLVVEVLSQSNHRYGRDLKAARYLARGVQHYWIVDPDARSLRCLRATADGWTTVAEGRNDDVVVDPEWPDLQIQLAPLWAEFKELA